MANLVFNTFFLKAAGVRTCYSLSAYFMQEVAACLLRRPRQPHLKGFLNAGLWRLTYSKFKKQAGGESENGRGLWKPYDSINIATTTGLHKPLNDNAPYSLAPMIASLTDKVTHTGGLGCTGALHLPMRRFPVPVMDVMQHAAVSSALWHTHLHLTPAIPSSPTYYVCVE